MFVADLCADDTASTAGAGATVQELSATDAAEEQKRQISELSAMPQKRKRRAPQQAEPTKKTRSQRAVAGQGKATVSPPKQQQRKQLSGKANIDSLIKDLEKQLGGV